MAEPKRFEPNLQSLGLGYDAPDWFHDAKFGIYAHWGVYSVTGQHEWYPRNMYIPGHACNEHHIKTYGHPSEFGYKDLVPMWQAENWDPDAMLDIVKRAGAKYFCQCAVHHDNFDLWDSKHHRWNSVNMGPKRDIMAEYRDATKRAGLRWGATTHLARADQWFQSNKNSDAGGAYDGNDPAYQDFYFPPMPEGHDGYVTDAHRQNWKDRLIDLIDNYEIDLLYFDGAIPFSGPDNFQTGMEVAAHYYNKSVERNGQLESLLFIKNTADYFGAFDCGLYVERIATLDVEHRSIPAVRYQPWQCDFPILTGAAWSYNPAENVYGVSDILNLMTDVVSKNGCFLLNIPPKPDGTLEQRVIDRLEEVGAWMELNGDAIYGTRPFYPVEEGQTRFTTKGNTLNIIVREWPEGGRETIESIQGGAPLTVQQVELLGHGPVQFTQDGASLAIDLPTDAKDKLVRPYVLQAACDQPTKPSWID
jgi:alpha-L-fucosidase